MCFLITYTILNQTKMETEGVTKAKIIVQAPCGILDYGKQLYAYMGLLQKKGIVVSSAKDLLCSTDFSLFRYHFTFKTSYFDYVNKSLQEIISLNLEKKDIIKDEIEGIIKFKKFKLREFEYILKTIKVEISNYDVRNNEIDGLAHKREFSALTNEIKSLSQKIEKIKLELNSLERILRFNGPKYEIDYIKVDERITLGLFNNLFVVSFFVSILIYFFIILLKTVLLKKGSD